jgi:hypothetical protein
MGTVFPIRMRRAFFDATPGEAPDAAKIGRALQTCWTGLGAGAAFEYSKFILCLPARATHSRQSQATISTHPAGPFRTEHSVVTALHRRQLENKVSRDGFWPRFAACDLIPLSYWLDDGRTTSEPEGKRAESMSMHAHLVLGEHDLVRGILDELRSMDIQVDIMVSPYAAVEGVLSAAERNSRTLVIDIDRLTTTCGFFCDGKMVHSEWIDGGSYTILQGAAERLDTQPDELALWLNEREDIVAPTTPQDDMLLPLYPKWRKGLASLVDLDQAARKAAGGIVTQLQAVIETASGRFGLTPKRAVLAGDDSLTLRAMMSSLYQGGLICEWRNPQDENVQGAARMAMPGMARFMGMMKLGHAGARRQPYLEDYNSAFIERVSEHFQQTVPEAISRWKGSAVKETKRRSVLIPEREPEGRKRGPRLAGSLKQILF